MKIELPQEKLEAIVAEAVESGITKGVGSWEVQNEIRDAGTAALKQANLPALVAKHIKALMKDKADSIAKDVAKSIATGLAMGARDIAVHLTTRMLLGLTEPPGSYESSADRKRREERIKEEVVAQFQEEES